MYGKTMGVLNVYQRIGGKKVLKYTRSGNCGPDWKPAIIALEQYSQFEVSDWNTVVLGLFVLFCLFFGCVCVGGGGGGVFFVVFVGFFVDVCLSRFLLGLRLTVLFVFILK